MNSNEYNKNPLINIKMQDSLQRRGHSHRSETFKAWKGRQGWRRADQTDASTYVHSPTWTATVHQKYPKKYYNKNISYPPRCYSFGPSRRWCPQSGSSLVPGTCQGLWCWVPASAQSWNKLNNYALFYPSKSFSFMLQCRGSGFNADPEPDTKLSTIPDLQSDSGSGFRMQIPDADSGFDDLTR